MAPHRDPWLIAAWSTPRSRCSRPSCTSRGGARRWSDGPAWLSASPPPAHPRSPSSPPPPASARPPWWSTGCTTSLRAPPPRGSRSTSVTTTRRASGPTSPPRCRRPSPRPRSNPAGRARPATPAARPSRRARPSAPRSRRWPTSWPASTTRWCSCSTTSTASPTRRCTNRCCLCSSASRTSCTWWSPPAATRPGRSARGGPEAGCSRCGPPTCASATTRPPPT